MQGSLWLWLRRLRRLQRLASLRGLVLPQREGQVVQCDSNHFHLQRRRTQLVLWLPHLHGLEDGSNRVTTIILGAI